MAYHVKRFAGLDPDSKPHDFGFSLGYLYILINDDKFRFFFRSQANADVLLQALAGLKKVEGYNVDSLRDLAARKAKQLLNNKNHDSSFQYANYVLERL